MGAAHHVKFEGIHFARDYTTVTQGVACGFTLER